MARKGAVIWCPGVRGVHFIRYVSHIKTISIFYISLIFLQPIYTKTPLSSSNRVKLAVNKMFSLIGFVQKQEFSIKLVLLLHVLESFNETHTGTL